MVSSCCRRQAQFLRELVVVLGALEVGTVEIDGARLEDEVGCLVEGIAEIEVIEEMQFVAGVGGDRGQVWRRRYRS